MAVVAGVADAVVLTLVARVVGCVVAGVVYAALLVVDEADGVV